MFYKLGPWEGKKQDGAAYVMPDWACRMSSEQENWCNAPCRTVLGPNEQCLVACTSYTCHRVQRTVCVKDSLGASDPKHSAFLQHINTMTCHKLKWQILQFGSMGCHICSEHNVSRTKWWKTNALYIQQNEDTDSADNKIRQTFPNMMLKKSHHASATKSCNFNR